ncbi:uncharacterized protein LOC108666453 [Hyalella azteca]|uniref:Uncharacterized protein LOC108666453 n=1 Tax=Hyalella azteca TaxID=294128 RepID=A0A8B7N6B4_HYAAZ|nr:uncharacterized protein LOC108666453 [Hyalella azteca]
MREWGTWMQEKIQACPSSLSTRRRRSDDGSDEDQSVEDLRSSLLSPAKKEILQARKARKMQLVGCVVNAMNITLLPDGTVDTEPMVSYLSLYNLDAELLADFTSRIQKCGSKKIPDACRRSSSAPVDAAMATKMSFIKCKLKARLDACVVNDVKKNVDKYKLNAFEEMMNLYHSRHDDSDDHLDLYSDEDDG